MKEKEQSIKDTKLNLFEDFKRFLHSQMVTIIVTVVIALACYAKHAFTLNVDIDTEELIGGGTSNVQGWLTSGRYGAYFTKWITGMMHYNPYMVGILFLLFFTVGCVLWTYLFYVVSGRKSVKNYWIFSVLYITSPLWTLIFYFSMFQVEMTVGMILVTLSLFLVYDLILEKRSLLIKGFELILSLGLLVWSMGIYQVFYSFYISGCICCYILYLCNDERRNEKFIKQIKIIVFLITHFVVAFIVNQLIVNVIFGGMGSYLSNRIMWGTVPNDVIFEELNKSILSIIKGEGYIYNQLLLVCMLGFLAYYIYRCIKKDKVEIKILLILVMIVLFLSPFLLHFYMGGTPPMRGQFSIQLVAAFGMMFLLKILENNKYKLLVVMKIGVILLGLVYLHKQMSITSRLFYTDDICNQQDLGVAQQIKADMQKLDIDNTVINNVVIVGSWQAPLNNACLSFDMYGISNYRWDYSAANPTGSTVRSLMYMNNTVGMSNGAGTTEQRAEAVELSYKMPSYPKDGYIKYKKGLIIIKLSDIY